MNLASLDTVLYASSTVQVGQFRCRPALPWFENSGPIQRHLIVFPRTSVSITHRGGQPIVANPNVVMLYNKGQRYRRAKLSERGDACEWFAFATPVIGEAQRRFDPAAREREATPFAFSHGPSDARVYLLQRLVVEHLLTTEPPDRLFVEETLLEVLARVLTHAHRAHGARPARDRGTSKAHCELVHDLASHLALNFREPQSLEALAQTLATSLFHLSRIFRMQTGWTIHEYIKQLRLRTALEYLDQGQGDLANLGINLGFSSHSHFSQSFRTAFGVAPSRLRRADAAHHLRELSKNLVV